MLSPLLFVSFLFYLFLSSTHFRRFPSVCLFCLLTTCYVSLSFWPHFHRILNSSVVFLTAHVFLSTLHCSFFFPLVFHAVLILLPHFSLLWQVSCIYLVSMIPRLMLRTLFYCPGTRTMDSLLFYCSLLRPPTRFVPFAMPPDSLFFYQKRSGELKKACRR